MAKYFYVYSVSGGADSIVKMFNTDTCTVADRVGRKRPTARFYRWY